MTQDERDDDRVIELPGDRDEVGNEVERHREVAAEREQQQLSAPRNARIAGEARHEHDAVGNEPRKRPRVAPAAGRDEAEDEQRVEGESHPESDQAPRPPLHAAERMRASYDEAAVRFLRRRDDDDQPVDLNERSPELGLRFKDLAVLGSLMEAGADLSQARHVIYYLYAPTKEVAEAMAHEVEENDFDATVREPLPEYPDQWRVACEKHAVTSPDFVRAADDLFQGVADRHSAEYDGWEASL